MPVVEPKDRSLKRLRGLHLWHSDMSSCSQRVRAVLAEKGRDWESHQVSIPRGDNTTPEYLAINPKGLVPALVHDGVLMTESMDIIDYLDRTYPEPALRPQDPEQVRRMKYWMGVADEAQFDLKVLSHEFLFRASRKISQADLENFENNVENDVLVDFIRAYHENERLPKEMVTSSIDRTDAWFVKLDEALEQSGWLAGEAPSLADIAWMPNAHRMELMDWPLDRYAYLDDWFCRVKALPGYQSGIAQWEQPAVREMLTAHLRCRQGEGYHVRNFGVLADPPLGNRSS